ncbi:hypothetical protein [Streptomyces sp. NPDC005407]|uniref:hypothetical protein n=1 Tax=Streptomyces sp. NPDC005407 TaxID=3155340 RepID=UPI0033AC680D
MSNWTLSVDMRGQGDDLAGSLRTSAREARRLGAAARSARTDVLSLGESAQSADRQVTALGVSSDTARRNLVRLAAQARDAARDLRDIARAAAEADAQLRATADDVRITARLDDDTGPGMTQVRTAMADLQSLSPVRLNVQFDGDTAQITAVAAAMRDLHQDADRARTALGLLAPDATAAAAALNAVQNAAQDTSRALRTLRGRAAATAAALDDLAGRALAAATGLRTLSTAARTADGRLDTLSGRARTLRGDLDDLNGSLTNVTGNLGGLTGNLGTVGQSANNASGGTRNLLLAAAGLATALIPIAAATVPIAAGMAAAGVGVGVFTAAVVGQIVALSEASEAQEKYDEAVREHGKASPEAAEAEKEHLRQIREMPPATREAAAAFGVLKDDYKEYSDGLAGDTMPVVTKSMQLFSALLPKTTGLVRGTSKELDHLLNVAAGGMQTPGFDRFMRSFTEFAVSSLAKGTAGIVKFTQALDKGEIGDGLREFLDYARANAPLVGDTLRELAGAAMHLLVAFSDVGVSVLQIVHVFAQLANSLLDAIPPGALTAFLQVAAVMKLVTLSAAALGAVTGSAAVARLGAYFAVMRAAGVATTLSATAASMSMMTKAALGLGVLAVAAIGISKLAERARGAPPDVDRLTTSLKELAQTGQFTGELKKTFGDLEGFVDKVEMLSKKTQEAQEKAKGGATGLGRVPLLDDIGEWIAGNINDMKEGGDSLKALGEDFKSLDQVMAGMVASGHGKQASEDFALLEGALRKSGKSTKEIAALFPQYKDAVAAAAAEAKLAAAGMGLFGAQAMATKQKLDAQKASADGLRGAIQALNDVNRAALGGMIGFEAAIDEAAKAAKDNAGSLKMVNGELDLNSPKAQAAATALQDLGAKTDDAAAAARASGKPWEYVNGIYERGREALIKNAIAMGLNATEAAALADTIQGIPEQRSTLIEMRTEDAITALDAVITAMNKTPNAKSVTVKALTADAVSMLKTLGLKVTQLKDGSFEVTAETGEAHDKVKGVQHARDGLKDKTITINGATQGAITDLEAVQKKVASTKGKTITMHVPTAEGRKQLEALGFKIQSTKGKTVTVSVPTGGQRANVAALAAAIAMLRNRDVTVTYTTVYRIKGTPGGPPAGTYHGSTAGRSADGNIYGPARRAPRIEAYAGGGMRENHVAQIAQPTFRMWAEPETGGEAYIPFASSKRPRSRAIAEETVRRLGGDPAGIAWYADGGGLDFTPTPPPSLYQLSGIAGDSNDKKGNFSLEIFARKLQSSSRVARAWRKDLATVSQRAGADVAQALEDMGEEGIELTRKMATGSAKYTRQMAANLRALAAASKATLGDYTGQLTKTVNDQAAFQANLVKLAGRGQGDLAQRLAAQGDQAAADLAAAAVKDPRRARQANAAAGKANNALSDEQVQQLVAIIAAIKTSTTGLHTVADTTGLGEDDIITIATKATGQIKGALGSRATKFLADLARANKGLSYASGGIRPGIYSTARGAVTFAEPETGGEAFIPLGAHKRRVASTVLRDVARRFGVGLTDVSASRHLLVLKDGDTHVTVTPVRTGATASDIGAQVGRSVRRAKRGGVNARA